MSDVKSLFNVWLPELHLLLASLLEMVLGKWKAGIRHNENSVNMQNVKVSALARTVGRPFLDPRLQKLPLSTYSICEPFLRMQKKSTHRESDADGSGFLMTTNAFRSFSFLFFQG